jgi:hypothetical protein
VQLRPIIHMTLEGHDYVALPRADFERLQAASENVEALSYSRNNIAQSLVNARKAAGLTQVE